MSTDRERTPAPLANGCKCLLVRPFDSYFYKVEKLTGLFSSLCSFPKALCGVSARKEPGPSSLTKGEGTKPGAWQLHMLEEMLLGSKVPTF